MYAIERYGAWLKEIANDEYGLCKELSLEECKDIVKCLIKEAEFQNSLNRNFEKYSVDFFLGNSNTGHDMYAIERYGAWLKEIANDEYGNMQTT